MIIRPGHFPASHEEQGNANKQQDQGRRLRVGNEEHALIGTGIARIRGERCGLPIQKDRAISSSEQHTPGIEHTQAIDAAEVVRTWMRLEGGEQINEARHSCVWGRGAE